MGRDHLENRRVPVPTIVASSRVPTIPAATAPPTASPSKTAEQPAGRGKDKRDRRRRVKEEPRRLYDGRRAPTGEYSPEQLAPPTHSNLTNLGRTGSFKAPIRGGPNMFQGRD